MSPTDLLELIKVLAPVAALYAAIRADMAKILERATTAQNSATRAHERIDDFINKRT